MSSWVLRRSYFLLVIGRITKTTLSSHGNDKEQSHTMQCELLIEVTFSFIIKSAFAAFVLFLGFFLFGFFHLDFHK